MAWGPPTYIASGKQAHLESKVFVLVVPVIDNGRVEPLDEWEGGRGGRRKGCIM